MNTGVVSCAILKSCPLRCVSVISPPFFVGTLTLASLSAPCECGCPCMQSHAFTCDFGCAASLARVSSTRRDRSLFSTQSANDTPCEVRNWRVRSTRVTVTFHELPRAHALIVLLPGPPLACWHRDLLVTVRTCFISATLEIGADIVSECQGVRERILSLLCVVIVSVQCRSCVRDVTSPLRSRSVGEHRAGQTVSTSASLVHVDGVACRKQAERVANREGRVRVYEAREGRRHATNKSSKEHRR